MSLYDGIQQLGSAFLDAAANVSHEISNEVNSVNSGIVLGNIMKITFLAVCIFEIIQPSLTGCVGILITATLVFLREEIVGARIKNLRALFPNLKGGNYFLFPFRRQVTALN